MQVHLFFYFNKFLKHTTYLCICSYAVAVHCYNNDIPAVVLACWKIYAQSACVISQSFINMQTAHRSTYQQAHKRCLQFALKNILLVVSIKQNCLKAIESWKEIQKSLGLHTLIWICDGQK